MWTFSTEIHSSQTIQLTFTSVKAQLVSFLLYFVDHFLFPSRSFIQSLALARGCLIHSHSNAAPDSPQRAGLFELPMATEVQGNGFKTVISFDVNFIVNNYESVQERASHWGNICMPPVNPIMGVIELHSKSHTWAGATWSASNRAQLVIGWCLSCLGPLKICSLDGFFSQRSK